MKTFPIGWRDAVAKLTPVRELSAVVEERMDAATLAARIGVDPKKAVAAVEERAPWRRALRVPQS